MKLPKSRLDERQKLEMLAVYQVGFWVLFWGMGTLLVGWAVLGLADVYVLVSGSAVFLVCCVTFTVGCIRRGIWSEYFKPSIKNNLIASLIATAAYAFLISGSPADRMIDMIVMFVVMFVSLTILMRVTKKRAARLEGKYED
ncbi:MAG: hypothetical protein FWE32_10705 [Oscillospiraceae bacterium]|nr:hypothetical protein [Oscillospiraceae bacterium]